MTVRELIRYALQDLAVLAADDTADNTADESLAFARLNMMLGLLSAQGVFLFFSTPESFSLAPGTASYTIGSGGVFNTPRPIEIESAYIRDSAGIDHEVKVRPFKQYGLISNKATPGRPVRLFYAPSYPYGTIYLYYTPDAVESLYIVSRKTLTAFAIVTETISLPPGYDSFLLCLLVEALAPSFGKTLTELQILASRTARNIITGRNIADGMTEVILADMPGVVSTYNIDEG
jgi:hypothetical protein